MPQNRNHGIVITQTPFRVSFFGGGTDFPEYFNEHGGSVIGTAIDKYMYVTLNSLERFFDKKIRLSYAKLECVDDPNELEHEIVRCILKNNPSYTFQEFLDIHSYADLPSSSGVGSSSSFTVGMLNALYLLNGIYKTPEVIAKEAIRIERVDIKDAGGWQDQIFAAYGGFNRISFSHDNFRVEPICLSYKKKLALERSILMFFTGDVRSSASIQQKVIKTNQADKLAYFRDIQKIADEAFDVINQSESPELFVSDFGKLLHIGWEAKRRLSNHVSNEKIDGLYDLAMQAGAFGGKLCGAGGGGFLMFIVPQERREDVIAALASYKQLNVAFEDHGSRVIYSKTYQPMTSFADAELVV